MGRRASPGFHFQGVLPLVLILATAVPVPLAGQARSAPPDPGTPVWTAYTYQGRLMADGAPANGRFDFQFCLYRTEIGGSASSCDSMADVLVSGGLFTLEVDFGGQFDGSAKYLQIAVKPAGSAGGYTVLSPRQKLRPTPYALALPGVWTQQNETSPNIIGGHPYNTVALDVVGATIGGGGNETEPNSVDGNYSTVGGGKENTAEGAWSTVAGGWENRALNKSFVGGGENNSANGLATVGGGAGNQASAYSRVRGGGLANSASEDYTVVGGGKQNGATGVAAAVVGGELNQASGAHAYVGGGRDNQATATWATVAGGRENWSTKTQATIGGGFYNTASGQYATVPGGANNTAFGDYSFAAGFRAKANHKGSFVMTDSTNLDFESVRDDSLRARFNGGLTFVVNSDYWFRIWVSGGKLLEASNGAHLTTGGSWVNGCRGAFKEHFTPLDGGELLERLETLPVGSWNYIAEGSGVRHVGPTAEDFHAAFGVGTAEGIATVDADGVSLAAIQALLARLRQLEAENVSLRAAQRGQAAAHQELAERLRALEQRLGR